MANGANTMILIAITLVVILMMLLHGARTANKARTNFPPYRGIPRPPGYYVAEPDQIYGRRVERRAPAYAGDRYMTATHSHLAAEHGVPQSRYHVPRTY